MNKKTNIERTGFSLSDVRFSEFVWIWNRAQAMETPSLHIHMAGWLDVTLSCKEKRLMLLAFRSSGKSTLTGLFCAWMLMQNPSSRILVLSADQSLAEKMVRNTRRIIERHPLTGHMKPSKPDQWASDRFTIKRPREWRDPSMLAQGIYGNITGMRADIVICDDVEVPKTSDSAIKRADLREKLSEIDYVLNPNGLRLFLGTPHSHDSLYLASDDTKKEGKKGGFLDDFKCLKIPLLDESGVSVWPEKFDPEAISQLKKHHGPIKFQSQMMLRPVPPTGYRLHPSHLIRYDCDIELLEANAEQILRIGNTRMLSASCVWDPAYGNAVSGDGSVVACVFTGEETGYWLHHVEWLKLDLQSDTDEARQQCLQICDLIEKLSLPAIHIETNGIGKFLPGLLRSTLREKQTHCAVLEIYSRNSKTQRILEAFDPILAARALRVHQSVFKTDFINEMLHWRPGDHRGKDDALDAVAHCLLSEPVRFPIHTRPKKQKNPWRIQPTNAKIRFKI